jgi:hypothetical protein
LPHFGFAVKVFVMSGTAECKEIILTLWWLMPGMPMVKCDAQNAKHQA